jgi:hypothetical protein
MHFHNYFPYHLLSHTYVPIRAIRVLSRSACASALSGPDGLSVEFFVGPYFTKSPISFRVVIQQSNRYMHTFNCALEIIETK